MIKIKSLDVISKFSLAQCKDYFASIVVQIGETMPTQEGFKGHRVVNLLVIPEEDVVQSINHVLVQMYSISDAFREANDKPWKFRLYDNIVQMTYDTTKPQKLVKLKDGTQELQYPLIPMLDDNGDKIIKKPTCWFGIPSAITTEDGIKNNVLSDF